MQEGMKEQKTAGKPGKEMGGKGIKKESEVEGLEKRDKD